MPKDQGSLELLASPTAQKLLSSATLARLAYVWSDGTPRVVPIWFYWNGSQIVIGSPPTAPKVKVIQQSPKVALTIDGNEMPYRVLMIRGTAQVSIVDGVPSEYAAAAERYWGPDQGKAWVQQIGGMFAQMARIAIQPEWVGILDFEQRFPAAIENAMAG